MPLAPPLTAPLIAAQLVSVGDIGISSAQLALAVATGLELYASSGLTVASVDAGTLGAGVGTGVGIILPPPVLIGTLTAAFASHGILGLMAAPTAIGLGTGISLALQTALISTVSAGVGVGAGVATLVPNPGASAAAFLAGFAAAGLIGIMSPLMAAAIAMGFDLAAPSGIGPVVIAGPPSIVPGAGAGVGLIS